MCFSDPHFQFDDRTNPMDKHMEVMIETFGFEAGPPAAQMFGNAGREHMQKYGNSRQDPAFWHSFPVSWFQYRDRASPMAPHAKVVRETYGMTKSPLAAQMFGNAGREHMEKYGKLRCR